MVTCFPSTARRTATWKSVSKRRKNVLHWNLGELIALANEAGWLPAKYRENPGASWNTVRAAGLMGDFVQVVRETRNLIHPGKYLRTYPSLVVKEANYRDCYEILKAARSWFLSHIELSLQRRFRKGAP